MSRFAMSKDVILIDVDPKEQTRRVVYQAQLSESAPQYGAGNPGELKHVWGGTTPTTYFKLQSLAFSDLKGVDSQTRPQGADW